MMESPKPAKKSLEWKNLFFFSFYFASSISLILYQKNVIKKYPYPISIVICHLIIKFLLAWLIRTLWGPWRRNVVLGWSKYLSQLSLIGLTSALDIGLSNWSIEFISVSLYTITKTTSTPFILLFALVFKLEKKSWALISTVLMIFTGLFIFSYESTSFHFLGFIMVLSASLMAGLRWTYTQLIMQKRSDLGLSHPLDMMYHVQPMMILTLILFSVIFEGKTIATSIHGFRYNSFDDISSTLLYIFFGGLLAFFMEVSEYFVIYSYSSLTLAITGVAKDIVLIIGGISIYHDVITPVKAIGVFICLAGIIVHILRKQCVPKGPQKQPTYNNRSTINIGDNIPLLSDSDFSDEEEIVVSSEKFKEMDDDFILNSDHRAWDSVKNTHLSMSLNPDDRGFVHRTANNLPSD